MQLRSEKNLDGEANKLAAETEKFINHGNSKKSKIAIEKIMVVTKYSYMNLHEKLINFDLVKNWIETIFSLKKFLIAAKFLE